MNKHLYYRKRRKKVKYSLKRLLFIFLFLYISSLIFAGFNIDKIKGNIIKTAASNLFEAAVAESIGRSINYIENSETVNESLAVDASALAALKTTVLKDIEKGINKSKIIFIPLGNFTGLYIFEGMGFPIPLKLSYVGSVKINFTESIVSAGVNQTLYTLKLNIEATMFTNSLKYQSDEITLNTEYILAQKIIVGAVPSNFYKG